jgi:hypothetical protein
MKPNNLLLTVLLFFLSGLVYGQLSIRASLVSPTGYLGAVVKKAPSLAIGKIDDFDGTMRWRMLGEFTYFSPRRERFDTYAYLVEGNKETVYPGTQTINLYMNLAFSFGLDYSILNKKEFTWYAGADLLAGLTLRQYKEDIPYVVTGSEFAGVLFVGLRGRTGVEYEFDKFSLFLEMSRCYYLNTEAFLLNYNDYGIGIRF